MSCKRSLFTAALALLFLFPATGVAAASQNPARAAQRKQVAQWRAKWQRHELKIAQQLERQRLAAAERNPSARPRATKTPRASRAGHAHSARIGSLAIRVRAVVEIHRSSRPRPWTRRAGQFSSISLGALR